MFEYPKAVRDGERLPKVTKPLSNRPVYNYHTLGHLTLVAIPSVFDGT